MVRGRATSLGGEVGRGQHIKKALPRVHSTEIRNKSN